MPSALHPALEPMSFLLGTWRGEGEGVYPERGAVRPVGDGTVDLTLAHPIGVAEVAEGTLEGTTLSFHSTGIVRTETGSPVTEIERRYRLVDGALAYELDMATEGVARTFHVRTTLTKVE